jgi:hypothetical protein
MMTVYGPHQDDEKLDFLQELRSIHADRGGPWLMCGDFILIYKAEDKSNDRLNRRLMSTFRCCL